KRLGVFGTNLGRLLERTLSFSSRFADGCGQARNSAIVKFVDIHTLMICEVLMLDKRWERREELALTFINGPPHPLTLLARLPRLFGHHSAAESPAPNTCIETDYPSC